LRRGPSARSDITTDRAPSPEVTIPFGVLAKAALSR
jgi:hypothetical protein